MTSLRIFASLVGLALCLVPSFAQDAAGLKKLAVGKVKPGKALQASADKAGKRLSMDRMTEALDSQLIAALSATRKYEVIGRSDADALQEEAGATGRAFDFGDADYLLVVSVDDFQDVVERKHFAALGKTVSLRTIRFSAVGKIYDAKTNKVMETANFQDAVNEPTEERGATDGDLADALLVQLTRSMAEKIANKVVDVGYPARVLAKTNNVVTVNRGEGAGIEVGQLWEVFALGEDLTDPDTGASLGREEMSVGKVRVTRVAAKTSQAQIVEDTGIDRGALLRRVEN
jgi:hypothetical protein